MRRCVVTFEGGAQVVAEVADTDALRERGLAGRIYLAPDAGMLFVFAPPLRGEGVFQNPTRDFTTEHMRFSIDVLFIGFGASTWWVTSASACDRATT